MFKQPGTEVSMHLNSGSYNLLAQSVYLILIHNANLTIYSDL